MATATAAEKPKPAEAEGVESVSLGSSSALSPISSALSGKSTSSSTQDKVKLLEESKQYSLDFIAGTQSLLIVVILVLACIVAFSSRLFAVIRFESIIHEFDPW